MNNIINLPFEKYMTKILWVSVYERLPENPGQFLVLYESIPPRTRIIVSAMYTHLGFYPLDHNSMDDWGSLVTHWAIHPDLSLVEKMP